MNTKEKIFYTCAEMLSDIGFNAFSFHDIAKNIGIKTSSIHYYFPTKADLIVAIIRYSQNEQITLFTSISEKMPQEKLAILIDFYVDLADSGKMCPIVAISSDMKDIDLNIKLELRRFYDFLSDWLRSTLEEGISKHHFACGQLPAEKSIEILNILVMLPILSRLGKDTGSFASIKKSLMDNLLIKGHPENINSANQ